MAPDLIGRTGWEGVRAEAKSVGVSRKEAAGRGKASEQTVPQARQPEKALQYLSERAERLVGGRAALLAA